MLSDPTTLVGTAGIVRRLEVLGSNKLMVPGCEPTSTVTSPTLLRQPDYCKNALVDVQAALSAIPGSTIEYGENMGGGYRKRWFVLPLVPLDCCDEGIDWFAILRGLPRVEPAPPPDDECSFIGTGYCPSPDFKLSPAPSPSTYHPDGTSAISGFYTP